MYRATCRFSGSTVVLKVYDLTAICELYQFQIFREIRLHSKLQHPHVVDLLAAFREGQQVVLVLEHAPGGDLFALLGRYGGRLAERMAVQLVLEPFLRVMAFMHARGLCHRCGSSPARQHAIAAPPPRRSRPLLRRRCLLLAPRSRRLFSPARPSSLAHPSFPPPPPQPTAARPPATPPTNNTNNNRDIKPENLLFTGELRLKVADFGLAIDLREERAVTRAGTLDYMAPEILNCPFKSHPDENKGAAHLHYGQRVDSWAVGVMTYELLSGTTPFADASKEETERRIRGLAPTFPRSMSAEASDFISRALAKHPGDRPTVHEMLAHPFIAAHALQRGAPVALPAAVALP